jgi:hypothetical protein
MAKIKCDFYLSRSRTFGSERVNMRLFHFVAIAIALLLGVLATDNGLQTDVEWDNGSLIVNGERVILMSGEFREFAHTEADRHLLTPWFGRLSAPSRT